MDEDSRNTTGKKKTHLVKDNLKKIPLKYKLFVVSGCFVLILFLIFFVLLVSQFESVNSTEVAGSKRYDSSTANSYEQSIIDFQEDNNIVEYVDDDNKSLNRHEAYYDALFRGYEQYKMTSNTKASFFESIKNFFTGIFKSRSDSNLAPYKDNQSSDDFDKPYGVQIDTSLITTTLYSNRFYGDMIIQAEMQEDKSSSEYIDFFLDGQKHKYYDLHSANFRDKVEVKYFEKAREDEEDGVDREVTKLAISGIEILSKYMIQRVETYYTLNSDFVGVEYDTTRHIKIVHKFNMSEDCYEYVSVDKEPYLDHKRSVYGEYSWNDSLAKTNDDKETLKQCKDRYDLSIYDDASYDTMSLDGFDNQYSEGYDELDYEVDCEGYKEYLLGNYPTSEDKILFCKGDCYSDNFIASYYHSYVPTSSSETSDKIEDIVYDIYSVLSYYEDSTMNYNVCSNTDSVTSYFDLSCGGNTSVLGDCSFNGVTVELLGEDGKVAKRVSMKDYIMGVARAERDTTNVEYLRAMMVVAKSYLLSRGDYTVGNNTIQIRWSDKDQVYASLDESTYRYVDGKYSYYDSNGDKGKLWKSALSDSDKAIYSEAYDSIANYVLIRKELATIPVSWGYDDETEHTNSTQKKWESLISSGMSFNEALSSVYGDKKLVECNLSADNSYTLDSSSSNYTIQSNYNRCSSYVDDSTYDAVKGGSAVNSAASLIGRLYRRGDEFESGQAGGDCSGLTTYVYNNIGVDLARMTANSQYKKYKDSCVTNLKSGDILFWAKGNGSSITHTGVYVGEITYGGKHYTNAIIDASSSYGEVVIRELWSTDSYPLVAAARPYAKGV